MILFDIEICESDVWEPLEWFIARRVGFAEPGEHASLSSVLDRIGEVTEDGYLCDFRIWRRFGAGPREVLYTLCRAEPTESEQNAR